MKEIAIGFIIATVLITGIYFDAKQKRQERLEFEKLVERTISIDAQQHELAAKLNYIKCVIASKEDEDHCTDELNFIMAQMCVLFNPPCISKMQRDQ